MSMINIIKAKELRSERLRNIQSAQDPYDLKNISKYYIEEYNKETLNGLEIGNILTILEDMPYKTLKKSLYIADCIMEISKTNRYIEIIKAREQIEISNKVELKNQTQRDAQLTINLSLNDLYNELSLYLDELQKDKLIFTYHRDYYYDLNRNLKIEVKIKHDIKMAEIGVVNNEEN